MKRRRAIGIFGGAFDPVHEGHVKLASAAARSLKLDRVVFVPTGTPPHKSRRLTPARHRLNMLRIALRGRPGFGISRFEVDSSGRSYTLRTMRHFSKKYPGRGLVFICGSDAAAGLPRWHKGEELLSRWRFAAAPRLSGASRPHKPAHGEASLPREVISMKCKIPPYSSTDIRDYFASGAARIPGVNPLVAAYAHRHRLYMQ